MPELLLALDAGTTNLRVCLFTPRGDLVGQATAPVRSVSPAPGLLEQDAQAIWAGTRRLIARALEAAGRSPQDLAAIGVTSQRTSAVLRDRGSGKPVSPLVIWSDLRGAARARELHAAGFSMAAQQASAKLEAMVAGADPLPAGRLAFGNIDSWLIWKLTGGTAHVTDRSQGWPLGYMDMTTLGWNTRLLEYQGLSPDIFPTLVDSWGEMGRTSTKVLGAEIPICADIADQQSALIGQGCETAGQCIRLAQLFVEAGTHGVQWAATGRLPPVDLPLREDLRTRLGWGHIFALQPLAEGETRAALRREADRRGIFLSDEVMDYLLTRFRRDLGHLMALLDRLDGAAADGGVDVEHGGGPTF